MIIVKSSLNLIEINVKYSLMLIHYMYVHIIVLNIKNLNLHAASATRCIIMCMC